MDIIKNANIKSYWIGASNVLYKQQRHISDVLVDVSFEIKKYYDGP